MVKIVIEKKGESSLEIEISLNILCEGGDFFRALHNSDYVDVLEEESIYTIELENIFGDEGVSQCSAMCVLECIKRENLEYFHDFCNNLSRKKKNKMFNEVIIFADYYNFDEFTEWIISIKDPVTEYLMNTLLKKDGNFSEKIMSFILLDNEFAREVFLMINDTGGKEKLIKDLNIPDKNRDKFMKISKFEDLEEFLDSNFYNEMKFLESNPYIASQISIIDSQLSDMRKVKRKEYYVCNSSMPLINHAKQHLNYYELGLIENPPDDKVRMFINKYDKLVEKRKRLLTKKDEHVDKTSVDKIMS